MEPRRTLTWAGSWLRGAGVKLLVSMLTEAHARRDQQLQTSFQRSLPFADGMFDRWERAQRLGFGPESSIYDSALVYGKVVIGENTWIGPNVLLDGSGGPLEIGSFCAISAGSHIYTHDTVLWAVSGGRHDYRTGPVRIGSRSYLGAQSIVVAGTVIGDQCVVGANSFVNRDVPDRTVVAGSPARPIGRVEVDADGTFRVVCVR